MSRFYGSLCINTIPQSYTLGPCSSVGLWQGTNRHTEARDQYTFCIV